MGCLDLKKSMVGEEGEGEGGKRVRRGVLYDERPTREDPATPDL